ncbi:MAG TPA: hypothetical protein VHY32_06615 [Caulobacteraceae bacterium]|nr:hypothetical protein [Caulobacteraceae bacterium]
MARPALGLGLLVGAALACAALASAASAGDRYSGYDDRGDGYAQPAYEDSSTMGRGPDRGYDARYSEDRYRDGRSYDDRREGDRVHAYDRRGYGEVEEIDPCARQARVIDRGCRPEPGGYHEQGWGGRGRYAERPDAEFYERGRAGQDRYERRADEGYGAEGYYGRETYEAPAWPVYPDESEWRTRSGYGEREVWVDRREADEGGYIDACEVVHERMGDRCPYAQGFETRRIISDDRAVTENLPDTFFISEGGVGPGIVDFGGGGGGGGEFASADSFSNASANASASASASASLAVKLSIASHNHMMMHHYPMKGHYGGGGCGCKK